MTRQIPITFYTEMIKAIYEGRKNMTRRIEGLKILNDEPGIWRAIGKMADGSYSFESGHGVGFDNHFIKPRYHVGDECWLKEVWASEEKYDNVPPRQIPPYAEIWFPDELGWEHDNRRGKIRSSRFICKWMVRRWLRITKVKEPQRVNLISEADAIAEGLETEGLCVCPPGTFKGGVRFCLTCNLRRHDFIEEYGELWNRLHKKPCERFEHGPWVFPYEFEMIDRLT